MELRTAGLGTVVGIVLGFALAEVLIEENDRVYAGIVTICVVLCTSAGGWFGRHKD
ncbi:hypothetical protein [Oceanicola sp. S124]|uniref:hypothetical protein n=1 Tax=Oceanicola sp. S124 TaxID=1042378 RepID=UPI0002FECA5A|nr:hypothetical protein [Oceanicola sp. S124]